MQLKTLADLETCCNELSARKKLAVIKAEDDHTLSAVMQAHNKKLIDAILIGESETITKLLGQLGYKADGARIIHADSPETATKAAIQLLADGEADYLMKGTVETKTLMRMIVDKSNGLRTDRLMSQISILETSGYHKLFALSDSALNPKPDLQQKKQIILNSVDVLHSLGIAEPKVAVLAASETVNQKLQESTDAFALKEMNLRGEIPGCIVEGPISIDLALQEESARIKQFDSPVAGHADLLICPDLVSGNIMGKGMLIAGAQNAGIIVGAKVPIVLCSRSANIEDKFYSVLLGAIACR